MEHYLLVLTVAAVVFELLKVVYRLYLAPLAGFPGPKLAAVTYLYAAYYDMVHHGSFTKQLPALHRTYGPVVRISPQELHVQDLECYHKIFKVGTIFDKSWEFYDSPPMRGSVLAIPGTPAANKRRELYHHYFSKLAIRRADDLMQKKLSLLVDVLRSMAKENRPVDLSRGYRCLTADIITEYGYQEDFGGLTSNEFIHPVIEACDELLESMKWTMYFRRTVRLLDAIGSLLPDIALAYLSPQLLAVREFQRSCAISIQRLKQRSPSDSTSSSMFDIILNPEGKKSKVVLSDSDLTAEAVLILLAGMDTTSNALVLGTWEVLRNEQVYKKLMKELYQVIPDKTSEFNTDTLDRLPYLKGVIKESLRLTFGAPGRLPRTVPPSSGLTLLGKQVPAGTIISHSSYLYHTDEAIFPDAQKFLPERWLQSNARELENNLLSFSRGSRVCLGMHLANAELCLTFARVFRTFEMKAFETTPADMEWDDFGIPVYRGHLKVMMNEIPG